MLTIHYYLPISLDACTQQVCAAVPVKVKAKLSLCLTDQALRPEDVCGSEHIDPRISDL
jgi:hypothetical protein